MYKAYTIIEYIPFIGYVTGVNLKSGQTLNGHNSIIFKYYEKEKNRFESKFNLVFIFTNLYSQSSRYYGHY